MQTSWSVAGPSSLEITRVVKNVYPLFLSSLLSPVRNPKLSRPPATRSFMSTGWRDRMSAEMLIDIHNRRAAGSLGEP